MCCFLFISDEPEYNKSPNYDSPNLQQLVVYNTISINFIRLVRMTQIVQWKNTLSYSARVRKAAWSSYWLYAMLDCWWVSAYTLEITSTFRLTWGIAL